MTRRHARTFDALTEAQLIQGLTATRRLCISTLAGAPIGSGIYVKVSELMDAIDEVVEVATGDRTFLHLKPHTTPGPDIKPLGSRPRED